MAHARGVLVSVASVAFVYAAGGCAKDDGAAFAPTGSSDSAGTGAGAQHAGGGSGASDVDASGGDVDASLEPAADGGGSSSSLVHHAGVRELPTAGAPRKRRGAQAVWTGSEMIVFGGGVYSGTGPALGGRYDPKSRKWSPLPEKNAPCYRSDDEYVYAAYGVWTGSKLVIWCGVGDDHAGGGTYTPGESAWTQISETGAPDLAPAVWTGSRMLVIGDYQGRGASYDPSTDTWTPIADAGALSLGDSGTLLWSGAAALVWGGADGSKYSNAGAAYDPKTDHWTAITTTGAPSPRSLHSAVWTGKRMLVWGGYDGTDTRLGDGGAYDPATDTWTKIAVDAHVSGRERHTAVWSGSEMIVWGGAHGPPYPTDKGRYDPATRTWSAFDDDDYRYEHCAVWTGSAMLAWGGVAFAESDVFDTGIEYVP